MAGQVVIAPALAFAIGISLFVFACVVLGAGAGVLGSKRLRASFAKQGGRWYGVGVGTMFTAIVQSSASTILLVIGFVNSGIMSLGVAATVIYGANIGTTITAHIVALGLASGFTPVFCGLACVSGFAGLILRKDRHKIISGVVLSFCLIFIGLHLVSASMEESEVGSLFTGMNEFLLIGLGFIFTSLVQSSSIATSLIVAAISAGTLGLREGVYIALGSNVGSCVIILMAGHGSTVDARRLALVHFFFNIIGVAVFVLVDFLSFGGLAKPFGAMFHNKTFSLTVFHTFFKIVTTFIVLPFTDRLVRLVIALEPGGGMDRTRLRFYYIDKLMLQNPTIAVQHLKSEVINMSTVAIDNFRIAIEIIRNMNFSEIEQFKENKDELNYFNNAISRFFVNINSGILSKRDRTYVSSAYRTVIDIKCVGDCAENVVKYAQKMDDESRRFPDSVNDGIAEIRDLVCDLYDKAISAYSRIDKNDLREALDIWERINVMTSNMRSNHIHMSNYSSYILNADVEYTLLSYDVERIANHFVNVGKATRRMS